MTIVDGCEIIINLNELGVPREDWPHIEAAVARREEISSSRVNDTGWLRAIPKVGDLTGTEKLQAVVHIHARCVRIARRHVETPPVGISRKKAAARQ